MSRSIVYVLLFISTTLFSQERSGSFVDAQYFYGTLLRHNKNIANLVREHPSGFILSYNRETFGEKRWQREYNDPDWGVSFLYQDFKYDVLGENYSLFFHYNFYFLNRNLQLRFGQGVAYTTNPFDIETNFKNIAYGSELLASTYLMLNYHNPDIYKGIGVQGGFGFIHHSNGSIKAPNSGTNVLSFNLGVLYSLENGIHTAPEELIVDTPYSEKIKYNFVLRGSYNEGDYYNLGQHPYIVISAFADKRLSYKNTIQFGVDLVLAKFLEAEIDYLSKAFPNGSVTGDEDWKRASLFVGHEFRLGTMALVSQFGYYIYYPYEYETRFYTRIGAKHYITDKLFVVGTVKTHAANAEAIALGLGVRL